MGPVSTGLPLYRRGAYPWGMYRCPKETIVARVRRMTRLTALVAQVRRMDRRARYRLYMSMMGHPPHMIEGDDWAFILHRMVAGSHNLVAYEKEAARIRTGLMETCGLDADGIDAWYRRVHANEPTFLDPVIDLAHRKTAEYYAYAGHPVHGGASSDGSRR